MIGTKRAFPWVIMSLLFFAGTASAEVVRCEVASPSHPVMPTWIEYEVNARKTAAQIRDSVRTDLGIGWITGKVEPNAQSHLILEWDEGLLPTEDGWADKAKVEMRLTRLADGSVTVTARPTDSRVFGLSYHNKATCTP